VEPDYLPDLEVLCGSHFLKVGVGGDSPPTSITRGSGGQRPRREIFGKIAL
jgi:hypothetical protein